MTYDDLKEWPLKSTRVSCGDGKFGTLIAFDDPLTAAVVQVDGAFGPRVIEAEHLEPGDHETLVQIVRGSNR